ncbi:MAG: hypothetical protein JSR77_00850 [Planctomycetes bacterium]|nr:hypothetical protein [Planctomycetota bacterium]
MLSGNQLRRSIITPSRRAIGVASASVMTLGAIANAQVFTDPAAYRNAAGQPDRLVTVDDLAHNTTLTSQYAGVNFGGTVRTWDAVSFGGGGTAVSPRNVLFNFGTAPMRWTFSPPARALGVYNPSIFDRIRLRLLRADNSEITAIDMATGVVTFAGYIAGEDIVSVEAAGIAGFSNFTIFLDNLEWNTGCPRIRSQPASQSVCAADGAQFNVGVSGAMPFGFQWQMEDAAAAGGWRSIGPGPLLCQGLHIGDLDVIGQGTLAFTAGPDLRGAPPQCGRPRFRCVVSNNCGAVTSNPVTLLVCACLECPADFNQDGGIDGADVDWFFGAWESGACDADVNADGGVDGADVDTFFMAWEAGGC